MVIAFIKFIFINTECKFWLIIFYTSWVQNQRNQLPLYNRWNHVYRTIPIDIPNERNLATDKHTDTQQLLFSSIG